MPPIMLLTAARAKPISSSLKPVKRDREREMPIMLTEDVKKSRSNEVNWIKWALFSRKLI